MLNHEGPHSEYFEELCALAAGGQISEPELATLRDHLQQCAQCRSTYADFVDLVHHGLPLADPELGGSLRLADFPSKHSSYRERFLARARRQGVTVPQAAPRDSFLSRLAIWLWPVGYAKAATAAIGLLLLAVGILGYSLRRSDARSKALAAELAAISRRLSEPGVREAGSVLESRPPASQPAEAAPATPAALPPSSLTDIKLAKARQDYAAAEAHAKALEAQLQTAASELELVRSQRQEANDSRNQVEQKLTDAQKALARAGDEIESIRKERAQDVTALANQTLEIRDLSAKLAAQTETLERERTLLAAGRDIHDLMGARNLHVVDVLDVDSKGKDKRAFGRVFYTEGKSLIFYAFDLGDRSTQRRNASFQVWGARGPAQNPTQSMGIFYVDDQKQNRWVMKFEDPRILAEIDSVFVTVEPPGGSTRPTGRKFLYAYLKANPNHP